MDNYSFDTIFKKTSLTVRNKKYEFLLFMGDDDIVYYNKSDVLFHNKTIWINDNMEETIVDPPTKTVYSNLPRNIFRQIVESSRSDLASFMASNDKKERELALVVARLLDTNLTSSEASK